MWINQMRIQICHSSMDVPFLFGNVITCLKMFFSCIVSKQYPVLSPSTMGMINISLFNTLIFISRCMNFFHGLLFLQVRSMIGLKLI